MNKPLCRSHSDRMLGGVCGGLANSFNIDVVWIRLFFILLTLGDGIGLMFYVILWIVLPDEEHAGMRFKTSEFSQRIEEMGREVNEAASHPHPNTIKFIGFGLVIIGLFYLLKALNLPWLQWINHELLFPVLLITGGAVLLYRAFRNR